MTGAFIIFSNLLRRLTFHIPTFARQLITTMVAILTSPSVLDLSLDTFREAVGQWILHIFVDGALWRQVRIKSKLEKSRGFVVGECVASPNIWTVKVAQGLVAGKEVDDEFKLQWQVLVDTTASLVKDMR